MSNTKFINRVHELETLEKEYSRKESSLVIVYGRRRVGKTSLINRFLLNHKNSSLYFLATQESELQNARYFCEQVGAFIKNDLMKNSVADWLTGLKLFSEYKTKERKILVLDEFQYLGIANKAFPSVIQKAWDLFLKDSNIMLILCGSLVTLMQQQTLDYASPLYGRRTAQIKLKQIPFNHYHEFFPKLSEDELVRFYSVTGGIPKYIETFEESSDIFLSIANNVLNKQSYLYEEPFFLLQNEVTEIGSYFSLIKSISLGNRKLSDISAHLGVKQTNLTKYLKTLSDLDLIEREVPVTEDSPEKSKMGLYRVKDNFISFWFQFVYPYRSYLERGETDYVIEEIKEKFIQNYVSYVYEDICREKMWEFASKNLWKFRFNKLGRYWGNLCGETDIVALDTNGKNMILGECKYSNSEKGLALLHDLEEKSAVLLKHTQSKSVSYIIFSKSGFTKGLTDEAKKRNDVTLVSGFNV